MEHEDHVDLIRDAIVPGVWADLGSGDGAFTLALADLLGSGARILSVDRDASALRRQRQAMVARFPAAAVDYIAGDFTRPLVLRGESPLEAGDPGDPGPRHPPVLPSPLDGVVMANSLHFVRHKEPVLELVRAALVPAGRLVLVEYDADRGNPWVPHPLSFETWEHVAAASGFTGTRLLARRPSRYLGAIYSALSFSPGSQN